MSGPDLQALRNKLASKYGEDAAQEAVLALLTCPKHLENPTGYAYRVAYWQSARVTARRGSHRPGAPRRIEIPWEGVHGTEWCVQARQLERVLAREALVGYDMAKLNDTDLTRGK